MNKPEKNYFSVNRVLLHSNRWLSEKFTRGQAWIDLFGLAQHTDSYIRVRGIKINIKRGQLGNSQLTLANRWKWSRGKIKRFLNELEMDGDIEQQNSKVTTLITIKKYNLWQGGNTTNRTTDGQQTDNKQYTYNKDNKDNNKKKETQQAKSTLLINYLIEQLKVMNNIKSLDDTVKKNRQYAYLLVKNKIVPEFKHEPNTEKIKMAIDKILSRINQDQFHKSKSTTTRYIYYNFNKIIK